MPVVVVTGAGRGIGAAIARLAAAQGYAVAVNYARDAAAAQRVVAAIEDAGGRAAAIRGDVAVEAEVHAVFAHAEAELGPVTFLVNNAGITGRASPLTEVTLETLQRVFAVNVIGAMLCARELVRRIAARGGAESGAIVNVSSQAARLGSAGEWIHYAASKAALETFTIGLARELASNGIRVNAVSPGIVDTEIHAAEPGRLARMAARVPLARAGEAREIAEGVLWLLSPAASYVTGAIVPISGGL